MKQIQDIHIEGVRTLLTPAALKEEIPLSANASETVFSGRQTIEAILRGEDPRLLVIIGPCSLHDEKAAVEYAQRLSALQQDVDDQFVLVMRAYFEKPRTTVGWKGMLNDPHLNGSFDIEFGLRMARRILRTLIDLGIPTATEVLDPIVPQYLADLVCWAAIGARTTESQTHREMASGLSMPIGFKNGTDGNIQIACDAMQSACSPHHFLGIDQEGRTCVISAKGNCDSHLILRGGNDGPNFDADSVANAQAKLRAAGLKDAVMLDCSHANSAKNHNLQGQVLKSCVQQRLDGNMGIMGIMIESNLHGGNQKLDGDASKLQYGVSITDACMDWESTAAILTDAAKLLRA
jgi:3-deoxy-7-phosphoheptulonate synthase